MISSSVQKYSKLPEKKVNKDNIATKKYDGATGLENSLFEENVKKIMGID